MIRQVKLQDWKIERIKRPDGGFNIVGRNGNITCPLSHGDPLLSDDELRVLCHAAHRARWFALHKMEDDGR